jgi:hypothetical protein
MGPNNFNVVKHVLLTLQKVGHKHALRLQNTRFSSMYSHVPLRYTPTVHIRYILRFPTLYLASSLASPKDERTLPENLYNSTFSVALL